VEILLNVSLPFFGLIAAGYAAGHFRLLPEAAAAGLNTFVFWFALPAMLFMKMSAATFGAGFDWNFIVAYSGGGLISFAVCVLLGRLLFRPSLGESGIQGIGAAFGNIGYLGLPIVLTVFGEAVLLPAVMVIVFDHILLLPLATAFIQAGQGQHASARRMFVSVGGALVRNPLIVWTVLGISWGALGIGLPSSLQVFGNLLSGAAAPCALFALGATLVGRPLVTGFPELALISACKLLLHPALAFGIATWLAVDPLLTAVATIEASLPVAANVFVMARAYGVYVERASSAILFSTLCAVVTVSTLLAVFAPR